MSGGFERAVFYQNALGNALDLGTLFAGTDGIATLTTDGADIDDLTFPGPPTGPVSPFKIPVPDRTIAYAGIDLIGDFADLDFTYGAAWRQEYGLAPGNLLVDVFVDSNPVFTDVDPSRIPDLGDASDLDVNNDKRLDVELFFKRDSATLGSEAFIDVDFGPVLSFLNFGIRGQAAGVTIFDNQIGPLFQADGTVDAESFPLSDTSIDLAFEDYSIKLAPIDVIEVA